MVRLKGSIMIRAVLVISVISGMTISGIRSNVSGINVVKAAGNTKENFIKNENDNEVVKVTQEYYDIALVDKMTGNKSKWPTSRVDSDLWVVKEVSQVMAQPNLETAFEPLTKVANEDENFMGTVIKLSSEDRVLIEKIVQQESGGGDILAPALVAQCIRDTFIYKGYDSFTQLFTCMGYTELTNNPPTESTKEAVRYIFDEGGMAVKHRMVYFYAPAKVYSAFHESQNFVIEYAGHRYFDER